MLFVCQKTILNSTQRTFKVSVFLPLGNFHQDLGSPQMYRFFAQLSPAFLCICVYLSPCAPLCLCDCNGLLCAVIPVFLSVSFKCVFSFATIFQTFSCCWIFTNLFFDLPYPSIDSSELILLCLLACIWALFPVSSFPDT